MNNILIFGASGHAKVIIDIVEKQAKYKIAGIIDLSEQKEFFGYPILGGDDALPEITKNLNIRCGIIAIGDNYKRKKLSEKILNLVPDFEFVTAIHPATNIARDVTINSGTVIMAGATINSSTNIGKHVIINTNSTIDHDAVMQDFSSLAPGVTCGGDVKIGKLSAICLGANIIHGITIGDNTVIGAGSTVINNQEDNIVALGTPAKKIKDRELGDKYY